MEPLYTVSYGIYLINNSDEIIYIIKTNKVLLFVLRYLSDWTERRKGGKRSSWVARRKS